MQLFLCFIITKAKQVLRYYITDLELFWKYLYIVPNVFSLLIHNTTLHILTLYIITDSSKITVSKNDSKLF